MNWEAIGAIGEVAGAAAVFVTLIYLALQIRQNTQQTRLSAIQAINASNDRAFEPIYIPENSIIFTKGQSAFESLTEHEKIIFDMLMMRLFASLDTSTYQYEQGAYDREQYYSVIEFYAGFITSPGGRQWYLKRKSSLSESTCRRLEAFINGKRNDA